MTTPHDLRKELVKAATASTSALLEMEGFGKTFTASLNEVLFHQREGYSEAFARRFSIWFELDRRKISLEGNICRNAAEWYIANDELPPPWLKGWLLTVVRNTGEQDHQLVRPPKNCARDLAVFLAVIRVCKTCHFKPTRNDATAEPSGCSIVAEALGNIGYSLSEKSVARIWNRFAKGRANEFWELVSMPDDD